MKNNDVRLLLFRNPQDNYTNGTLYYNDVFCCYTLEPKDRKLINEMSLTEIKVLKVEGKTAIPYGEHEIEFRYSLSFSKLKSYNTDRFKKLDNLYDEKKGLLMPYLKNVKGFTNVMFHIGNYVKDTLGCILCGLIQNEDKAFIGRSADGFYLLMEKFNVAVGEKQNIKLLIQ